MQLNRALALLLLLVAARPAFASGACSEACPDNWFPGYPVQCFQPIPCACGLVMGNPQCVADAAVPNCGAGQVLDCTTCSCIAHTPTITPTATRTPTGATQTPTRSVTPGGPTSTVAPNGTMTPTRTRTPTRSATIGPSRTATPSPSGSPHGIHQLCYGAGGRRWCLDFHPQ